MKRVDMLDSKSNAERRESSNLSSRTNQKIIMKICCVDVCNKECVKHCRYCHEHYLNESPNYISNENEFLKSVRFISDEHNFVDCFEVIPKIKTMVVFEEVE